MAYVEKPYLVKRKYYSERYFRNLKSCAGFLYVAKVSGHAAGSRFELSY